MLVAKVTFFVKTTRQEWVTNQNHFTLQQMQMAVNHIFISVNYGNKVFLIDQHELFSQIFLQTLVFPPNCLKTSQLILYYDWLIEVTWTGLCNTDNCCVHLLPYHVFTTALLLSHLSMLRMIRQSDNIEIVSKSEKDQVLKTYSSKIVPFKWKQDFKSNTYVNQFAMIFTRHLHLLQEIGNSTPYELVAHFTNLLIVYRLKISGNLSEGTELH